MREVQEICAFINDLQARFLGVDTDTYVQTEESLLRELYSLQEAVRKLKVNTLEDYLEGMKLKSLLSSLFCYCFNNGKEEYQKVGAIEAELGKKLLKFARNYGRIKDKRLRAIAKYMITCFGLPIFFCSIILRNKRRAKKISGDRTWAKSSTLIPEQSSWKR